ncbi:RING finger ubiquitin ligase [Phytophthora cinnamomi]|uniref:RING finger ubiquitin ligase n=1 Tax=Phytophthora cinnamomi TaxID=4785 RepID=UPI00355A4D72|nr:RING finger ubiquitin ligase [Phytophthora cinnamomi]
MNYNVFFHPTQAQVLPLSASAIAMLRESVHPQLPLQFRVTSTAVNKNFVMYKCDISSVTIHRSWSLSYRYSDFAEFAKNVEELWTCPNTKCYGSCQAIREFIWACFPSKRPSIMSRSSRTVADRKSKFEAVVKYLLRCVMLPGSAMRCLHARRNLPPNLFKFLGAQHDADKRSLLQVFVDNCQGAASKCNSDSELRNSFHSEASTADSTESTQCMICLDEVELGNAGEDYYHGSESSIILPCQHTFHRGCIFEWLLFQYHCPLCRVRVGPAAVTTFCQEKNHIFQWWLSNFEEDPLTAMRI